MRLTKKLKSKSTQCWKIKLNVKNHKAKKISKAKKKIKRIITKIDKKKIIDDEITEKITL